MRTNYNVNHESINLADFPDGKTQDIAVKIGRRTIMVDITADCRGAQIIIYDKLSPVRSKYSKYAANLISISVQRRAVLDRSFFDKAKAIANAQSLYRGFKDVIR